MQQLLVVYLDSALSIFICAYRKAYHTQYVLIRLLEGLKTKLDNNDIVGAVVYHMTC